MRNWLYTESEEDRSKQEVERRNQGFVDGLSRQKTLELDFRFCRTFIEKIWSDRNRHLLTHFASPGHPRPTNNDAYSMVVKEPMDLCTIRTKFNNNSYQKAEEFEEDVRFVLGYCYDFPEHELVNLCGRILVDFYYELIGMKEDWIAAMAKSDYSSETLYKPRSPFSLPEAEVSKELFTRNVFARADKLMMESYPPRKF